MATLATQLDQLENAGLVRPLPEEEWAYLFKHALMQEAAYQSLLLKSRTHIHHRVAKAYEALFPDRLDEFATLLAEHYAEAGDGPKMVEYAIRAGERAVRLGAHQEARDEYARALQALARLPDNDENRRTRIDTIIKRTSVSFTSASPEQNLANLREAESLAESLGRVGETPVDRLRLARIHMWIGRMHFYRVERRLAVERFRQVLPVAQEIKDQELEALASTLLARILLWEGEFGQALPWLEQALEPLEQSHNWTEWVLISALLGVVIAARGDYELGVAEAERGLKRAQELQHRDGISVAYSLLAVIHLMGGDLQKMLETSRLAAQVGFSSGNILPTYSAYATSAWAESRLGQHEAAQKSIAQSEGLTKGFGGHFLIDDWLEAVKAEAAFNAREIDRALVLAKGAVTFAQSVDGHFAEAQAQRTWGQALAESTPPQWAEADAHLERSVELFEAGEARLEAARTHVAWGQVLQARGNNDAARQHFEQAAAQFQTSGLTRELERTNQLIAALPG
ncbi:MAG TPA: hypothetical protein VF932_15885 [Anaerolineae bacterium]